MFSIAAHGHVNPSLEVIRELVARGHRVTYAIPHAFAELVAGTGAQPRVYGTTLPGADDDPEAWGTELIDNVEPFLEDARQALPQLIDAYEGGDGGGDESEGGSGGGGAGPGEGAAGRDIPDLVLSDITSYPARVLAHRWGVPHIQLSPNLVAWEGYEEEVGAAMAAELRSTPRGTAYYERFASWLAENGIALDPDDFAGRPERSLVLIPKVLQPNAERVNEDVYTFVGACQGDRTHEGEWRPPRGREEEKVLLVSLGSAFTKEPEFYRACVEAFGGLHGWYVVMQIGRHVDPAELGPLPAGVEVHPWVPQLAVLQHADAFVTHAGAGGSQEGLATATPMIAVPQAVDQFGNAEMLVSLGVARHVPKEQATPQALREALEALTGDPRVARSCARAREAVAAEGGTRQAADLIEAALGGSGPARPRPRPGSS